jgi:SAM-dependent methyltransferase
MKDATLDATLQTALSLEKIEILPVSLLDDQRPTVNDLKRLAHSLGLEFGWHYLLDLTWIINHLRDAALIATGSRIMDAGAGTGILQWYLAEGGAQVLSVDRGSRANLPLRFRHRFNVEGMRGERGDRRKAIGEKDLAPFWQLVIDNFKRRGSLLNKIYSLGREISAGVWSSLTVKPAPGRVILYNQDLKSLPDIADGSLDAVVAVSALEHNPPGDMETVVAELLRTLKPGGLLLATLCAAPEQCGRVLPHWFHQPSAGWCYSEASLRRIFDLPESAPSNYADYPKLFTALLECAELRDNLASFYFKSGDNGMPWGKWEPQYLPVGVCKVKS